MRTAVMALGLIASTLMCGITAVAQSPPTDQPITPSSPAPAQTAPAQPAPDALITAVRAYRASMAAGDVQSATDHAGRAYRLSKERDGLSARTGLLAYNYAVLLLEFGERAAALPAAQDAAAAPETGAANGPTRLAVQTLLGQAQLARGDAAGVALVRAGLAGADPSRPADLQFAYRAGVALGDWYFENRNWSEAAETWRMVRRFAGGAIIDKPVAEATALLREGQALMRLRSPNQALARFRDAETITAPLRIETAGTQTTPLEGVYGTAVAWRIGLELERRERRNLLPGAPFPITLEALAPGKPRNASDPPLCTLKVVTPTDYSRYFESNFMARGEFAAAVVRVALNADGQILGAQIVAIGGLQSGELDRYTTDFIKASRFQRDPSNSTQNCRMNSDSHLIAVALAS